MCLKLFFVAGYQKFVPCEYHVEKDKDGQISFVINAGGEQVYRMDIGWNSEIPSFTDYQNQINHPWNIHRINESKYGNEDEVDEIDDEEDDEEDQ